MKYKYITGWLLLLCVTGALFGQTREIGIRRPGPPPDPTPGNSQAQLTTQQQVDAARLQAVPSAVRAIRERQLEIAKQQQINVIFRDKGRVSETAIQGVPADLGNMTITGEEQVIALAASLYPLFGFSGTERLVYQRKVEGFGGVESNYIFAEEINGLPVESMSIDVAVGRDQKIRNIQGTAVINQNFAIDPPVDVQTAIDAATRHVEAQGFAPPSRQNSASRTYLIYKHWDDYRTLAPWWYVELESGAPYYVDPNGNVSSAITITP